MSFRVCKVLKKCDNTSMIICTVLIFLIVLFISGCIYFSCKRLIYKLNKRVLGRNLAIIKNGSALGDYENLTEDDIREKLIIPFFQIMGYNTYDRREFSCDNRRVSFVADYIAKKWDNSRLCKEPLYIKYANFNEDAVDLENFSFKDKENPDCNLDELMCNIYFSGEYYVLTNGYLYVFFSKKRKAGSQKFDFCFNLKGYSKDDISRLAYFTKQCMFLEISDVYISS